jgi:hypothetical protein
MDANSLNLSTPEHLNAIENKDTWIYTFGSAKLQQVRSFGYECEEPYLKERLKIEYPGFKINKGSIANKLDCPPMYAIKSLKWHEAYIAKQYLEGEVIAIDNYLGKYQIIKKTAKPWYLIHKNLYANDGAFYGTLTGILIGLMFWAVIWN